LSQRARFLFPLALALGCASAGVTSSRQLTLEDEVVRPSTIVVYDFAVAATDVAVDDALIGGTDPTQQAKRALGRDVANALAESLVAKLREAGIPAERADPRKKPPLHALIVKGHFEHLDQGDRTKRMVIGFGAGASELRAQVRVFQVLESGVHPLAESEAQASGSKMPGMAVPVAGGAAAGRAATSAAISGTLSVTREVTGGLEADAARLGEALAERAVAFYERRGWL
jgi:hypothetical protein